MFARSSGSCAIGAPNEAVGARSAPGAMRQCARPCESARPSRRPASGNPQPRFPRAVGGAREARFAMPAASVEHQQRRADRAGDAHRRFDRRRRRHPFADQIAERDRRGVRVFRRRRPRFDRHRLIAEQRAGVGQEGARQAVRGVIARQITNAPTSADDQHEAQLERIEFIEPRADRRRRVRARPAPARARARAATAPSRTHRSARADRAACRTRRYRDANPPPAARALLLRSARARRGMRAKRARSAPPSAAIAVRLCSSGGSAPCAPISAKTDQRPIAEQQHERRAQRALKRQPPRARLVSRASWSRASWCFKSLRSGRA